MLNLGEDIREVIGKSAIIYKRNYTTLAIIYKRNYTTFAYIDFGKSEIRCLLRLSHVEDLKGIADIAKVKKDDPFKVRVKFNSDEQIDDALWLTKHWFKNTIIGSISFPAPT